MSSLEQTPKDLTRFGIWLSKADAKTRARLADILDTSRNMLCEWASGRRNMSAYTAGKVAEATLLIAQTELAAPRPLSRGDLCQACRECQYFQNGEAVDIDDLK